MTKASMTFNRILKLTLGRYLKSRFNTVFTDINGVNGLKPPYIILANHTNFWDPFIISMFIKEPVYFVTSDEYFRNWMMRLLLKLVGGIPKTKFVSDTATVNSIIKVIKHYKGIVGIYPEGRRNWDGRTLQILYPTAKLVKAFNIPVVAALSKGACLSFPRWASKPRKGRLEVELRIIADKDEITSMPVQDLYERICASLMHDEYDFQSGAMIPYKGKLLAEHIELFLFTCPSCRSIGRIKSYNDTIKCLECGYSSKYNQFGYLEEVPPVSSNPGAGIVFSNPHDWDVWQADHLRNLITQSASDESKPVFEDSNVLLRIGARLIPLKDFRIGRLALFNKRIEFTTLLGERFDFPFSRITGVNVQYNNQFEFYFEKKLYRFIFRIGVVSAYKWVKAFEISENKAGG